MSKCRIQCNKSNSRYRRHPKPVYSPGLRPTPYAKPRPRRVVSFATEPDTIPTAIPVYDKTYDDKTYDDKTYDDKTYDDKTYDDMPDLEFGRSFGRKFGRKFGYKYVPTDQIMQSVLSDAPSNLTCGRA
jgi:hypothetical protein